MRHSGRVKHRPIGLIDRALVAKRECDEHASVAFFLKRRFHAITEFFAQASDLIAEATRVCGESTIGFIAAHTASRAQVVFE